MVERLHDTQKARGSIPRGRTMEPKIIYEDKNFLAIDKPAGWLTFFIKGHNEPALDEWFNKIKPEVKLVHRLDKETSGIILAGKNQEYFDYLKNLFKDRQIKKTYLALVYGKLEPKIGIITSPIGIKSGTIRRTIYLKKAKSIKEAVTKYKVLKILKYNTFRATARKVLYFSLVELTPQTGRTHQIRIHLSSIGHPVIGDKLYGGKKQNLFNLDRHFLHAKSLEFSLKEGGRIRLEAGLPDDFRKFLLKLKS